MKKISITLISIILFNLLIIFVFKYFGIDYGSFSENLMSLSVWLAIGICFGFSLDRSNELSMMFSLFIGIVIIVNIAKFLPIDIAAFTSLLFLVYGVVAIGTGVITYFCIYDLKDYYFDNFSK